MIIACAYNGWVPEDVKAALPEGFDEKRYVAKFVNGELVELRKGVPEEAILGILPTPVDVTETTPPATTKENCKSCEDESCENCQPEMPSN